MIKSIIRNMTAVLVIPILITLTNVSFTQTTVEVFKGNGIQYDPPNINRYKTPAVTPTDGGRIIARTLTLPKVASTTKVTARLEVHPIPKGQSDVHDRWDRAGGVYLYSGGQVVTLVKFCTGFGGRTTHRQDVSSLAPLLQGSVTVKAFIDTWVPIGWKVDVFLEYQLGGSVKNPAAVKEVLFKEMDGVRRSTADISEVVSIAPGTQKAILSLYTSGHSIGGNKDEFESRFHVVYVDGKVVFREKPWRTDCRNFRSVNPFSGKWGNVWSSDLSRSGWCPGGEIHPYEIDLTPYLTAGKHTIRFNIENVYHKNAQAYGYWRASLFLSTYDNMAVTRNTSQHMRNTASSFKFHPAYPNPFNPETNIRFDLPKQANVNLEIYNSLGELIRSLIKNESLSANSHHYRWDGRNDNGNQVPGGVYMIRIKADQFIKIQKVILIK